MLICKPVALLLEVKSQINDNTQAIHPAQSMLQSSRRPLNMQQKPDQSVADHVKSFKAEKVVLVAQAGDMMFTQFVTNQKKDEIDEIKASGKTADEKKAETKAILDVRKAQIDLPMSSPTKNSSSTISRAGGQNLQPSSLSTCLCPKWLANVLALIDLQVWPLVETTQQSFLNINNQDPS